MKEFIAWSAILFVLSSPVWAGALVHHLEEKRKRNNGYKR